MKTIKYILPLLFVAILSSCLGDLDTEPKDNTLVAEQVYRDKENYKGVLAKCYAALALTGQKGMSGDGDIEGIDEGYSSYIRSFFYLQVITTDEAFSGSGSNGMRDMVTMQWTPATVILNSAYSRVYQTIGYCNEFMRQSTLGKLEERGQAGDAEFLKDIELFRDEARFIRAYCYWAALDAWGHGPFFTDEDEISGKFLPPQISRAETFKYVEDELKDLENKLPEPRTNEYGRVDKAAVWMLLARMYLNAEVYTGTARWADAQTYAEKAINSSYQLAPQFIHNFLADNHTSPEIIWPLTFDGQYSQSNGGSTFIVLCQVGGEMPTYMDFSAAGWGNVRTRSQFVDQFPIADQAYDTIAPRNFDLHKGNYKKDKRALVYGVEHDKVSQSVTGTNIKDGYASTKFRNVTKDGKNGYSTASVDMDYPIFRLADAYLMAAEAILRNNGDRSKALEYLNIIRDRAYETNSFGDATPDPLTDRDMTLDYILHERSRELAWELIRRTDLIRFGQFTDGTYHWDWKGHVIDGQAVDKKYNLFPIPESDITANPNLTQNPDFL